MAKPRSFRDSTRRRMKVWVASILCFCLSPASPARADGWCVYGVFEGQTTSRWIQLNNPEASTGASSVALAIAARLAGKRVSVYLDLAQDTCASFPNWSAAIRHVRMLD